MEVKAIKRKGIVSIDPFDVIKMSVGHDGNMEYKLVKKNVVDLGVENLQQNLQPVIDEFAALF
eukprot:6530585-Pyramimonas_sp.AAC.1